MRAMWRLIFKLKADALLAPFPSTSTKSCQEFQVAFYLISLRSTWVMLWHHFPPKKRSFLSNLFLLLFVCAADGREESSLAKLGFPPHPCLLTLISQPCQPCHPYPSLPPLFLAIISQHSHPCLIGFPPHPCLIQAGSHQPKSLRSSITHCKLVTPLVSHQSSIIVISEEVL